MILASNGVQRLGSASSEDFLAQGMVGGYAVRQKKHAESSAL